MAITDKQMQARPACKDQWFSDGWAHGRGSFIGRVMPTGERRFYFRYRLATGQRQLQLIGPYCPDGAKGFTVKAARERAYAWSTLCAGGGIDLRQHLKQERHQALEIPGPVVEVVSSDELTVECLLRKWRSVELTPAVHRSGQRTGRKDGGAQIQKRWNVHVLPLIGPRPIATLKRADVMRVLDAIKSQGFLRTHNSVLSELRQAFKFAVLRELAEHDPTAGIPKLSESSSKRWLTPDELRALRDAMPGSGLPAHIRSAFWLQLATACRVGELAKAAWSDVDLAGAVWRIPAENSKNGKPHLIHLSRFAIERLELLRGDKPGVWLFPGRGGEGPMLPTSINKTYADRQRSDESKRKGRTPHKTALLLPGGTWSSHDLRRTAATMMAKAGVVIDVIHRCLNHTSSDALTAIYVHDEQLAARKAAFDALGEALSRIFEGNTSGDAV